jgi:hypothetical protein
MFNDRDEVIVFKREDFASAFRSMMEQIEFIDDMDLKFNRQDDYRLFGLWPQIMGRVHIIDININDFLVREPFQSQLDAFLYPATGKLSSELIESAIKLPEKPLGVDWYK